MQFLLEESSATGSRIVLLESASGFAYRLYESSQSVPLAAIDFPAANGLLLNVMRPRLGRGPERYRAAFLPLGKEGGLAAAPIWLRIAQSRDWSFERFFFSPEKGLFIALGHYQGEAALSVYQLIVHEGGVRESLVGSYVSGSSSLSLHNPIILPGDSRLFFSMHEGERTDGQLYCCDLSQEPRGGDSELGQLFSAYPFCAGAALPRKEAKLCSSGEWIAWVDPEGSTHAVLLSLSSGLRIQSEALDGSLLAIAPAGEAGLFCILTTSGLALLNAQSGSTVQVMSIEATAGSLSLQGDRLWMLTCGEGGSTLRQLVSGEVRSQVSLSLTLKGAPSLRPLSTLALSLSGEIPLREESGTQPVAAPARPATHVPQSDSSQTPPLTLQQGANQIPKGLLEAPSRGVMSSTALTDKRGEQTIDVTQTLIEESVSLNSESTHFEEGDRSFTHGDKATEINPRARENDSSYSRASVPDSPLVRGSIPGSVRTSTAPLTPVPATTPVTPLAAATPVTPVAVATPVTPAAVATPVTPLAAATPVTPVAVATPVTPVVAATTVTPLAVATPVAPLAATNPTATPITQQSVLTAEDPTLSFAAKIDQIISAPDPLVELERFSTTLLAAGEREEVSALACLEGWASWSLEGDGEASQRLIFALSVSALSNLQAARGACLTLLERARQELRAGHWLRIEDFFAGYCLASLRERDARFEPWAIFEDYHCRRAPIEELISEGREEEAEQLLHESCAQLLEHLDLLLEENEVTRAARDRIISTMDFSVSELQLTEQTPLPQETASVQEQVSGHQLQQAESQSAPLQVSAPVTSQRLNPEEPIRRSRFQLRPVVFEQESPQEKMRRRFDEAPEQLLQSTAEISLSRKENLARAKAAQAAEALAAAQAALIELEQERAGLMSRQSEASQLADLQSSQATSMRGGDPETFQSWQAREQAAHDIVHGQRVPDADQAWRAEQSASHATSSITPEHFETTGAWPAGQGSQSDQPPELGPQPSQPFPSQPFEQSFQASRAREQSAFDPFHSPAQSQPRLQKSERADDLIHAFDGAPDALEPDLEGVTGLFAERKPPSKSLAARAIFNLVAGLFITVFALVLPIGGGVTFFGLLLMASAGGLYLQSKWGGALSAGSSLATGFALSLRFGAEDFPRFLKSPGMIILIALFFLYAGLHLMPRMRGRLKKKRGSLSLEDEF
ncbi:MAG: hypothetical protein VYD19_05120 [Myxococcota bacterium]|nr:hypothetical protein [Myxococcota bacterium]